MSDAKRKQDFIEARRGAAAEAATAAALAEDAKLAAMEPGERETYEAEVAAKALHEKRKGKALSKGLKGYKSSRSKILGGRGGKRRKKKLVQSSSDDEEEEEEEDAGEGEGSAAKNNAAAAAAASSPTTTTPSSSSSGGGSASALTSNAGNRGDLESGGAAAARAPAPPTPASSDSTASVATPMGGRSRLRSISDSPFVQGLGALFGKRPNHGLAWQSDVENSTDSTASVLPNGFGAFLFLVGSMTEYFIYLMIL